MTGFRTYFAATRLWFEAFRYFSSLYIFLLLFLLPFLSVILSSVFSSILFFSLCFVHNLSPVWIRLCSQWNFWLCRAIETICYTVCVSSEWSQFLPISYMFQVFTRSVLSSEWGELYYSSLANGFAMSQIQERFLNVSLLFCVVRLYNHTVICLEIDVLHNINRCMFPQFSCQELHSFTRDNIL